MTATKSKRLAREIIDELFQGRQLPVRVVSREDIKAAVVKVLLTPETRRAVTCRLNMEMPTASPAWDTATMMLVSNLTNCLQLALEKLGAPAETLSAQEDGDLEHIHWWLSGGTERSQNPTAAELIANLPQLPQINNPPVL